MKRITFLTAAAALLTLAASCGQNASKQQTTTQQEVDQTTIAKQKLNSADIPGEIPWQGDLIEAYRYEDNTGENIVITTESDVMEWMEFEEDEDAPEMSYKQFWAYRFQKHGNEWKEIWKVYDMESKCMNYPIAEFIKGALQITDLDNNGTAEIWMMYLKSCKGDVSPDNMFLRMYDNEKVYTMTGESKLELHYDGKTEVFGGEYTFDNQFLNKNTNPAFIEFAKKLWEKHIYGKQD